jgi:hypothetical protein
MTGVSRDAASGIYVPATSAEWTTTMSVAGIASGGPSGVWLCQEASGSLADSVGVFTLTAGGTGSSYQNAVTGWTRKAVGTTEANATRWQSVDVGLPDPATTSYLTILYAQVMSTPAATRSIFEYGTSPARIEITSTPRTQANFPAASPVTGASSPLGSVRPFVLRHNLTASTNAVYTDQEKLAPTFGVATANKTYRLGAAANNAPTALILYAMLLAGAAAELTDAQIKTLLQTLGWSIAWT